MKTKKKEIELIERKKEELEKQLNAIKEIEKEEQARKIDELIKLVKPEIDAFVSLINFRTKGKIQVELTYDIELQLYLENWDKEDIEFEGNCYINKTKEPKGYSISRFISEDCFGNMGLNEPKNLVAIHPEIKKHFEKHKKAKTALRHKLLKVANKLEIDHDVAIDAVDRFMRNRP